MGLELRTGRDGKLRSHWYGAWKEGRKRHCVNLEVRIAGTPPASGSLRDIGDAEFEASRKEAEAKLSASQAEAGRKGRAAHLVEKLVEMKTGRKVEHVTIAGLGDKVEATRNRPAGARRPSEGKAACEYFREFMATRRPGAVYLYEVTDEDATAFYRALCETLSPRTAHGYTAAVRAACRRFLPEGSANPFLSVKPHGMTNNVHRKPFTPEELRALLDASRNDDFLYPLIVAAGCTGMRRGDVCGLKWEDVDLAGGVVTARTSKTGEAVEVPIFAPLREVFVARKGNGSKYVFPEAAAMQSENSTGLTYRFKRLVARAFGEGAGEDPEPLVDAAEMAGEGADAIRANLPEGKRRERILDTFRRYCDGQSFRNVQAETGRLRSTISADLHAVEAWTGKRFLRSHGPDMKAAIARATRVDREHGMKAASVRDWPALRTTFVTLALSAGVPMELVKRVTGHKTVEVVMKHYFRPGRAAFADAFNNAMPDVLTGGAQPKRLGPGDELAALAVKVAAGTATDADKARLRKLASKVR